MEKIIRHRQRTATRHTPAGPPASVRPGLLPGLFTPRPRPIPPEASEARTVDSEGRVGLGGVAEAVGVRPGDVLSVGVDDRQVVVLTPADGRLRVRVDSQLRVTVPVRIREQVGARPGSPLLVLAQPPGILVVPAATVLRLLKEANR